MCFVTVLKLTFPTAGAMIAWTLKRGDITLLISGLQKLTLLDYPGTVACTVFTGGCNFRCPFCNNASLVRHE